MAEGQAAGCAAALCVQGNVGVREVSIAELQQKWFRLQAGLAREMGKPIVIHSRDAAADTLSLVRGELRDQPKVLHCFSYSKEVAAQCLDAGAYLGIGGVVTFKNGRKMKDVVEYMPADRLLLETDCPYLAPEPFRGRRNQSGYLPYVVRQIALIKGMTEEEVETVTWENAVKFYGIKASPLGEAVTAVGRD